jgi:hypothetical protein
MNRKKTLSFIEQVLRAVLENIPDGSVLSSFDFHERNYLHESLQIYWSLS